MELSDKEKSYLRINSRPNTSVWASISYILNKPETRRSRIFSTWYTNRRHNMLRRWNHCWNKGDLALRLQYL